MKRRVNSVGGRAVRGWVAREWAAIEDWLIPALRLNTHERALYYHLVRHTRLEGRRRVRMSRRQAARASGLSTATARHYLRQLARKRCIRFAERSLRGTVLEVFLPGEVAARWPRSLRRVPPVERRDACGQPRAWRRRCHTPDAGVRARVFHRDAGRCFYCRRKLDVRNWVLDHVAPVGRAGTDSEWNLAACCAPCNWEKGLAAAEDFLRSLKRRRKLSRAQLRGRLRALDRLLWGPPSAARASRKIRRSAANRSARRNRT
ncbi:MAG TPA: HNH endonuclease signature motif containing protein [Candidatus Acidoferrales bacterium]